MSDQSPSRPERSVQVQVVLYDSDRWLGKLAAGLAHLAEQGQSFSTAVWDNLPGAAASEFAARRGWTYVASPEGNVGFGRAHNQLSQMTGSDPEFLLLLNPDAVPFSDALVALVEAARRAPDAALLEAVQVPVEHPKTYDLTTLETNWCSAACLLVRRSVFQELGGFDPGFFLYGEDVDLSWRAWLSGRRCLYIPTARCVHVTEGYDWGKNRRTELLHQSAAGLRLRRKYFGEAEVGALAAQLRTGLPPRLYAEVMTVFEGATATPVDRRSDPHISLEGGGIYGPRRW